jgi:uncharacterized protein (TIGR03067 family)
MTFEFSYKLDTDAVPATIDMEVTKPEPLKGGKAVGIIAFEKDELKLCYHPEAKERPKKFESTKDNGFYMFVMKKDKTATTEDK